MHEQNTAAHTGKREKPISNETGLRNNRIKPDNNGINKKGLRQLLTLGILIREMENGPRVRTIHGKDAKHLHSVFQILGKKARMFSKGSNKRINWFWVYNPCIMRKFEKDKPKRFF